MTGELSYEQRFGRHRVLVGTFLSRCEELSLRVAAPDFGNARASWELQEGGPSLALASFAAGSRRVDTADNLSEDAAGNPVAWASGATAGPQAELRATSSVPRPPVAGLSWRAAVGGTLGILSPKRMPGPSRLYALATVSWVLDPSR